MSENKIQELEAKTPAEPHDAPQEYKTTTQRGGKREGAGRKPGNGPKKEIWTVRVTEAEKLELIKTLQKIRGLN